jgi:FdhD protein
VKLTRTYHGLKIHGQKADQVNDELTLEQPLSVVINGSTFTLTMQTPGHEEQLVRGLLFSEGVYKDRKSSYVITEKIISDDGYISELHLSIPEDKLDQSQLNKRSLLSVASCGICGKTELDLPIGKIDTESVNLDLSLIDLMFQAMAQKQSAFISSGGCHASSAFSVDFQMLSLMEDIGRHNAVDKVIGDLLMHQALDKARFLLVSGRVSYEIVVKCFTAGIPFLLAVSAPSTLAVDFAKELGITLLGFCRENRATVYSNAQRILS